MKPYYLFCLFIFVLGACASIADIEVPPTLENRTLRISATLPAFEYQWRVCKKQGLFKCREWEIKTEVYDLTDPAVRQKLIDMGFVARVKEKVLP